MIKNTCMLVFMYSICYSCSILMKHEFSWLISNNIQISKFMKIPPVEAEFFHAGRTDRHDETNSRFSQFCKSG